MNHGDLQSSRRLTRNTDKQNLSFIDNDKFVSKREMPQQKVTLWACAYRTIFGDL